MITAKKNKRDGQLYYFVRYELVDGRRKKEKVPPVLDASGQVARPATKQDAREFETLRKAQVLNGTWKDPDAPPPSKDVELGPTFATFAKTFLEKHPGRRRSNHYPSNVRELVMYFGGRRIREITRVDLDAYRVRLETTARQGRPLPMRDRIEGGPTRRTLPPLSSTTVLKRLRALHRMFKLAVRWGELAYNPAADLEKPSAKAGRTRWLSKAEYERMEAAAPPYIRPMMRLAVASGMRLKEVAGLRWDGVDFDGRAIHVSQDTKTGARAVPMSAGARAILKAQVDRRTKVGKLSGTLSPFVFVADNGADYSGDAERREISEQARAAAVTAGLGTSVGFHVLRHTAGSWMAQGGASLYEVQRVLGHSTPVLTQRYAHLQPDHLRNAIDALDNAMGNEIAPRGHISVTDSPATAAVN